MRAVVAAALLAAGCRSILGFDTPVHETPSDGGPRDGKRDARVDAVIDSAQPVCTLPGARVCLDSTHSGYCSNTLTPTEDHACPPNSVCESGHCKPPVGAAACDSDQNCASGLVCDLYWQATGLQGYCTTALGTQGIGVNCAVVGEDATCKTGLCAKHAGKMECYEACNSAADCSGLQCLSLDQPTMLEGATTSGETFCTQ